METSATYITEQTVRANVNERAFFASMRHLFSSSFSVMGELVQNARRAQATKVAVTCNAEQRLISISDNGVGIEDFSVLLDLATSGWTSTEVQLSDRPFGMGFFASAFAAARIVVYSKGNRLEFTQNDVVEQRSLKVLPQTVDQLALMGEWVTRIEMHGVVDEILPRTIQPQSAMKDFESKFLALVKGFPLPVSFNEQDVPRIFSIDALRKQGQNTDIGFVTVRGLHQDEMEYHNLSTPTTSNTLLFLQGLPIETHGGYNAYKPTYVVHLDSAQFVAQMPDRAHLYDSGKQRGRINAALTELVRSYLARQKAELDACTFVQRHWDKAGHFGVMHLFNDVGFFPGKNLLEVANVSRNTDYQHVLQHTMRTTNGLHHLYTYEDFKAGRVLAWRHAPSCVTECPWAATALKVMQSANILAVQDHRVDAGHWIHRVVQSYNDLSWAVDVRDAKPDSRSICFQSSNAEIREAHAAIVRITSKIDPAFREEHKIENDWLLVPEKESQDEEYVGDFNYQCWILGNSENASDHPVNALDTYNDENDRYMEEWETDAKSQWENVLAVLRNEHLSKTVNRVLSSAYPQFSEENLGQLVMVRLSRDHLARSDEPDAYCKPRVDVMPVGEGMLQRICEQLERQTGVRVNATQMANIVWHAVRPGELIDGPRNGAFHKDSVLVAPSA